MLVYVVRNLFENDTKAKEIDANAVATFRVKFDHVAMDNFHAVFTRASEPGGSPVKRRLCRNSSASSERPTIVSKATIVRLCWLSRDPTAMRTLLRAGTKEQQRSATAAAPARAGRRDGSCGAAMRAAGRVRAGRWEGGISSPVGLLLRQLGLDSCPRMSS